MILPVEKFAATGEQSLNCLSQPRGQPQKTLQSTGVCDPTRNIDDNLFQNLEIDPNRIKELARRYLEANVSQLDDADPIREIIRAPIAPRKTGAYGFQERASRDPQEIERQRKYYAEVPS